MAIILEAAYSKKLGLPHYSSHSFVVSIRTELADLAQIEVESARLYRLLQQSVDREIQQVGYLPEDASHSTHFVDEGSGRPHGNGTHPPAPATQPVLVHQEPGDTWVCSDKQKQLILKLVEQHGLDKQEVELLAKEMFGLPVKTLIRLQASGLIEELLERHGKATGNNGHGRTSGAAAYRRHARS